MYGALLSIFSRFAWSRLKDRPIGAQLAVAPVVSIAVVVPGALAFEVMFWTPRGLGADDDLVVGTYLVAVVAFATLLRAPNRWRVTATSWSSWAGSGHREFPDGLAKTAIIATAVAVGLMLSRRSKTAKVCATGPQGGRASSTAAHPSRTGVRLG